MKRKKNDDWQKPETWYKAHPGLGTSVREEYLAAECLKAKQMPAYENTFRRLMLNQWTEQATRWACNGRLGQMRRRPARLDRHELLRWPRFIDHDRH